MLLIFSFIGITTHESLRYTKNHQDCGYSTVCIWSGSHGVYDTTNGPRLGKWWIEAETAPGILSKLVGPWDSTVNEVPHSVFILFDFFLVLVMVVACACIICQFQSLTLFCFARTLVRVVAVLSFLYVCIYQV